MVQLQGKKSSDTRVKNSTPAKTPKKPKYKVSVAAWSDYHMMIKSYFKQFRKKTPDRIDDIIDFEKELSKALGIEICYMEKMKKKWLDELQSF